MGRWDIARTVWWLAAAAAFAAWFVAFVVGPNWSGGAFEIVSLGLFALIAFWLAAGAVLRAPLVRRRVGLPARRR